MSVNLRIRSLNANVRTHVLFVNITSKCIKAFWLDYKGNTEYQFTMQPKSEHTVNTYLTHPWVFRDTETGEFMQVENKNIFIPQYYFTQDPNDSTRRIPCRKQIIIHFPMQSLRWKCLSKIATLITSNNAAVDIPVSQFELPRTVEIDLKTALKSLKNWREAFID